MPAAIPHDRSIHPDEAIPLSPATYRKIFGTTSRDRTTFLNLLEIFGHRREVAEAVWDEMRRRRAGSYVLPPPDGDHEFVTNDIYPKPSRVDHLRIEWLIPPHLPGRIDVTIINQAALREG